MLHQSNQPTFTSCNDAVYTFEALPLNGALLPCAFHLMETRNGASSPEVCSRFFALSKQLIQIGYQVKFIATNGDISFDQFHYDFFIEKVAPLLDQPFMNIVHALIDLLEIPISDPFHLFKRAGARLVDHLVLIDVEKLTCVNTQILLEIAKLGEVLEDRSTAGAMKDAYSLALFSWETLILRLENGRFDSSFYLLPFIYLIETIRSPLLSKKKKKKKRLEFIEYSFTLFIYHFIQISKVPANKYFKKRIRAPCLGVFFADDIFLIRAMNTFIGLAIAICLDIENLALQRIASHDVELIYGHMRMISFFNHTLENALRAAVETIIIRKYSNPKT